MRQPIRTFVQFFVGTLVFGTIMYVVRGATLGISYPMTLCYSAGIVGIGFLGQFVRLSLRRGGLKGEAVLHRAQSTGTWSVAILRVVNGLGRHGTLVVSATDLCFVPTRYERLLLAKAWCVKWNTIVSISSVPRGGNPFAGGLREKFELVTKNGERAMFASDDGLAVACALRERLELL